MAGRELVLCRARPWLEESRSDRRHLVWLAAVARERFHWRLVACLALLSGSAWSSDWPTRQASRRVEARSCPAIRHAARVERSISVLHTLGRVGSRGSP